MSYNSLINVARTSDEIISNMNSISGIWKKKQDHAEDDRNAIKSMFHCVNSTQ